MSTIKDLYNSLYGEQPTKRYLKSGTFLNAGEELPKDEADTSFKRTLDLDELKVNKVNPQTIGLAISIGEILIGLFSDHSDIEHPDDLSNIGRWVSSIGAEVSRMNKALDEIYKLLVALSLRADTSAVIAYDQVKNMCDTYVRNMLILQADPRDSELEANLRGIYIDFDRDAGTLRSKGYAWLATVFYAFRIEIDLIRLRRMDPIARPTIARDYAVYFEDCLDPVQIGSLANVMKSIKEAQEALKGSIRIGTQFFDNIWYYGNTREVCRVSGGNDHCYTVQDALRGEMMYTVGGSIESGFTAKATGLVNIYSDRNGPSYIATEAGVIPYAQNRIDNEILPGLNAKSAQYQALQKQLDHLEELKTQCEQFLRIVRTYF